MPAWAVAVVSLLGTAVGGLLLFLLTVMVDAMRDAEKQMESIRKVQVIQGERLSRVESTRHAHTDDLTPVYPPDWREP